MQTVRLSKCLLSNTRVSLTHRCMLLLWFLHQDHCVYLILLPSISSCHGFCSVYVYRKRLVWLYEVSDSTESLILAHKYILANRYLFLILYQDNSIPRLPFSRFDPLLA